MEFYSRIVFVETYAASDCPCVKFVVDLKFFRKQCRRIEIAAFLVILVLHSIVVEEKFIVHFAFQLEGQAAFFLAEIEIVKN